MNASIIETAKNTTKELAAEIAKNYPPVPATRTAGPLLKKAEWCLLQGFYAQAGEYAAMGLSDLA